MRVGVIGNGSSGRNFSHASLFAEGVELVAVAGRSPERVKPLADRCAAATMTIEELLDADIDCVAVGTPPSLHARHVLPFIRRGVHAMVEKPMALCAEDCDAIIEEADKASVRLMVTQTHRYMPHSIEARRIIDSGEFGKPLSVHVFMGHDYFGAKRKGWHLDFRMSGGGVTFNPFIHMLDLTRFLAAGEVTEFLGHVGYHKEGFDIEGDARCLLKFDNGAAGVTHVDGYGHQPGYWADVVLEQAALEIRPNKKRLDILQNGHNLRTVGFGRYGQANEQGVWGMIGYINHFIEMKAAVEQGGPITSDGPNGRANVVIARGILEQNGAPVTGPTV